MDEITQAVQALKDAALPREAFVLNDVIRRQYQRRGHTPWNPGKPLPVDTIAFLIRNWVRVFDIPIMYREWPQDGHTLLMAAFKLQIRVSEG